MAMSTGRRKAHVVLPEEVIQEIDARVGQGVRSRFVEDAAVEKLQRLRRIAAFERAIATPTIGIPEWDTPESTAAWLRELRQDSDHWLQAPDGAETH